MILSIIIPAFNEESKIINDVKLAFSFLHTAELTGEVIVVDDGSTDETHQKLHEYQHKYNCRLQIVRLPENRGKGSAVRAGMLHSSGQFVMFADSGFCVPYRCVTRGLDLLMTHQCDMAFGSRKMKGSLIQRKNNIVRQAASGLFKVVTRKFLNIPSEYSDTQCGFKLYKGEVARELFAIARCQGFTFDIEILLRGLKMGYKVLEFPVEWSNDPDSRVSIFMGIKIIKELVETKKMILQLEKEWK